MKDKELRKLIGSRIKQRRLELNLTQPYVAEKMGVTASTILRYENGSIDNTKKMVLEGLSEALHVSVEWLKGETDEYETDITDKRELQIRDAMGDILEQLPLALTKEEDAFSKDLLLLMLKQYGLFLDSFQFACKNFKGNAGQTDIAKTIGFESNPHSAAYASEHGEMAQYNLSYQANSACKEAIEQTISAHYAENRLDTEAAVKDVLEKFGTERVQFILANTIQRKNYDGRISQDNKAWAKTIPTLEDSGASRHCAYLVVDQVNPGLTDLFTRQFRKVAQEQQKSSVLQKLKQELPAHKSAASKKREPER